MDQEKMKYAPVKRTLHRDANLHIELNETENWLEIDWTGIQTLYTVQQGCLVMLELLKQTGCHKVLNDNTHVEGSWSEAAEWGAEVWFPAMIEAGLRHFAWIYSPSVFSRLSTDKTINLSGAGIYKTFYNRHDAIEWLKSVD